MTSAICMAPDSFSRLQKNEALGAYSRVTIGQFSFQLLEIAPGQGFASILPVLTTQLPRLAGRFARREATRLSLSATAFAPASPTTSTEAKGRRCCVRQRPFIGRCQTT